MHDGLIADTKMLEKKVSLRTVQLPPPKQLSDNLEITFWPDLTVYDGRFANNGWLQELPKPVTKLVWDNAALISPALAKKVGLDNGDVIELQFYNRKLKIPVWITPGHAESSISLQFGCGRTNIGNVGRNVGVNAYELRTSNALWFGDGATLKKTGKKVQLVTTQTQHTIDSETGRFCAKARLTCFRKIRLSYKTIPNRRRNTTRFSIHRNLSTKAIAGAWRLI